MAKGSVHKITSYVVIDFETGGLDMSRCALTEIAMLSLRGDTLEKIGEYESLISPHQVFHVAQPFGSGKWIDAEYTEGAEKVTGLSREKLEREGQEIDVVAEEVVKLLELTNTTKSKTGYKPVLIAHNAQFEVKCLQNLAKERFDLSKYFHGDEDFYGNFQPHYIDTLDLAKLLWTPNTRQTKYKLSDVLERAGIPIYDAHRAMNDVRPSSQFFEWVVKLLRAGERGGVLNNSVEVGVEGETVSRSFKFQFN